MMTGTPEEPGGKVPDACTCANHPNCLVPHQRRVLVASAEWRARTSECSVMLAPREVVGEPRPALIRSSSPGRSFRPMEHALAYIDPGSGSLVVQVAVATVLVIAASISVRVPAASVLALAGLLPILIDRLRRERSMVPWPRFTFAANIVGGLLLAMVSVKFVLAYPLQQANAAQGPDVAN